MQAIWLVAQALCGGWVGGNKKLKLTQPSWSWTCGIDFLKIFTISLCHLSEVIRAEAETIMSIINANKT
jgi:hypothetical protein